MVQVPEESMVTEAVEVPLEIEELPTEHTDVVRLENETVSPVAAFEAFNDVAEMATVPLGANVWLAGVPKEIVWLALATVND
jgi:hypothetical protein